MTSTLTLEAEAAAAEVMARRDRARAKIARPVRETAEREIEQLRAEAARLAHEYLNAHTAIANTDAQLDHFLAAAGQPLLPRVTNQDTTDPLPRRSSMWRQRSRAYFMS